MQFKDADFKKIIRHYQQIELIGEIKALLGWDLNVNLPNKAATDRGRQSVFLTKLLSEKWQDKKFRITLEKLVKKKSSFDLKRQAILRNFNYQGQYYFKIPQKILLEFEQTTNEAFVAWRQAKIDNNYRLFSPFLKKIINLNQIIAKHLGFKDHPYDALLNLYEPGLTTKKCQSIFDQLAPSLKKLLSKVVKSKNYQKDMFLIGEEYYYPPMSQKKIAVFVLKRMGFDFDSGRMDQAPHPFTERLSPFDVRLTTWYHTEDFRDSLTAVMHEGGHALYEQRVATIYNSTPLSGGVSLGIHESQSRFWENVVGRSPEFLKFLIPILRSFYPDQLVKANDFEIIKVFNQVKPSLIRVEADEVTYNLHIALRFELEKGLIEGSISPDNLNHLWREKMKQYLGVVPKTDRQGILQDVHWAYGNFGYFPTYTLGNLYAAQFGEVMLNEIDLPAHLSVGDLNSISSWQRKNIHQHGSLFWPDELIKKVTGRKLSVEPFLSYLQSKYHFLYNC